MDCSGYSNDSEEYSHSVLEQVNNMNGAINGNLFHLFTRVVRLTVVTFCIF